MHGSNILGPPINQRCLCSTHSGDFAFRAPDGTFDIVFGAPGHLSVIIPGARIKSSQVLTIPELTLPFGDANGDGKIDIMDLSIAANNFGRTVEEVTPPQ